MEECSKTRLNQEKSLYENDGTPGEQLEAYSKPSSDNVEDAVDELNNIGPENPDNNRDTDNF
ncbi:MAG: hypothetical protein NC127_07955 [Muribaculum sp.]|nr:hypothetical protein [Muribaculum sp.]